MNKVCVFLPKNTVMWFQKVGFATAKSFQSLGYKTTLVSNYSPEEYKDFDMVFIIDPHGLYLHNKKQFKKHPNTLYCCWDLEQTPYLKKYPLTSEDQKKIDCNVARVKNFHSNYDYYFVDCLARKQYWDSEGCPAHILNMGYHPHYTNAQEPSEKKYDVLFIGSLTKKRKDLLEKLISRGVKVYPNTRCFDPKEKAKLTQQSKVCLNIHHNDFPLFEKQRVITDIMANRGFCISEHIEYLEGFVNGKHLITAEYSQLENTIISWVNKPQEERDKIIQNASNFISYEFRSERFLLQAIDNIL